jgi:hypothetical protein
MQSDISLEKIDLKRASKACSKANYMSNNNFNIPRHQKQTLTPKSDREGISYGFSMGRGNLKRLGDKIHTGSRDSQFPSIVHFFTTTLRLGLYPPTDCFGTGGE